MEAVTFPRLPVENFRVGPGSRVGLRREEEETFFLSFLFRIFFSIKELKKIGTNYIRKIFLSMDVKIKMGRDEVM